MSREMTIWIIELLATPDDIHGFLNLIVVQFSKAVKEQEEKCRDCGGCRICD